MQRQAPLGSSARLFSIPPAPQSPVSHNLQALRLANFKDYCASIDEFDVILKGLQDNGWLKTTASCNYKMTDFLKDSGIATDLNLSPIQILAKPLPDFLAKCSPEEMAAFPDAFNTLTAKLESYEALLIDTLNNNLAQKNYEEGLPDQENVSERVHALQAGKIAALVLPAEKILPMLLHDIARPTNRDQEYGHAHHCEEGSDICAPLGLKINYTLHHALAKYLLFHFCKPYTQGLTPETKGLISPVSTHSLPTQTKTLGSLLENMQTLEPKVLASFFFEIMFMRLIDDFSKVPTSELRLELDGGEAEYFNDKLMSNLFHSQLVRHVQQLDAACEDKTAMLRAYESQLDAAINLLMRAKKFTDEVELTSPRLG